MCGLCGFIGPYGPDILKKMTAVVAHRGPDDSGTCYLDLSNGCAVGVGSRRLAIQDLSAAGHMPMSALDGKVTIVYNGEVYNYPELRRELESRGYQFHSHSDTEAILYLYVEFGPEFVRRLNGMFAIAIWDARDSRLFLARDHFGIKPLYYLQRNNGIAFASEVKSLLQLPDFRAEMDINALDEYLTFLWVPDPLTLFKGVLKIPAGHYALWQEGHLKLVEYWDLTYPPAEHQFHVDETALCHELKERFTRSAQAQLLSDVPVGAFLSAGLDSTSIVAALAEAAKEPVRTFTIAFPKQHRMGENTLDDTSVAARTAAHFGCNHTEILVEPDVVSLLPRLVWHMDEPIADPAAITAYLVSREARKHVTVLLSGVGGDELFAGYRRYQAHFLAERYRKLPIALRRRVLEPFVLALPSMRGTPVKGWVRLAKKMARSGSLSPTDRFITHGVYISQALKQELYSTSLIDATRSLDPWEQHNKYFDRVKQADFLNQMLYVDSKAFMVSLNLTYNDKMSMASSVEVRVPFLDWEFADWCSWNIPPKLKLRNGKTKWILRKAMTGTIPAEVLRQKKAGFGAPQDAWLAKDLREMVDDLLCEQRIRERGLFQTGGVRRIVDEQRSGRTDWSFQIWTLLTLELWFQQFVDRTQY